MFLKIVRESFVRRRRRKLVAVAAVALGASVATAMLAVALGIGDKVNRELRSYGANIEVLPLHRSLPVNAGGVLYQASAQTGYIDQRELSKLKSIFWANNILAFAPFVDVQATAAASRGDSTPITVTVTGAWFDEEFTTKEGKTFRTGVRQVSPWWKVEGRWPDPAECLIGVAAAGRLRVELGGEINVEPLDRAHGASSLRLRVSGILSTGADEDQRIMAGLGEVQRLAGLEGRVSRVEVSALTNPEDDFARSDPSALSPEEYERWSCTPYARSIAHDVQQALAGTEAHPVLRVSQTEGALLSKIDLLMLVVTLAALAASLLGVASSMTTTVLERKPEIGLLKAIGASNLNVVGIFLTEAFVIGVLGGGAGFGFGYGLAQLVAHTVFGSAIEVNAVLAPVVIVIAVVVAFAGSAWPLRTALRFQPSLVLRER